MFYSYRLFNDTVFDASFMYCLMGNERLIMNCDLKIMQMQRSWTATGDSERPRKPYWEADQKCQPHNYIQSLSGIKFNAGAILPLYVINKTNWRSAFTGPRYSPSLTILQVKEWRSHVMFPFSPKILNECSLQIFRSSLYKSVADQDVLMGFIGLWRRNVRVQCSCFG